MLQFRASKNEPEAQSLLRLENVALISAVVGTAVRHGLIQATNQDSKALGLLIVFLALFIAASSVLRYKWSLRRQSFRSENWSRCGFAILFAAGFFVVLIFGAALPKLDTELAQRTVYFIRGAELLCVILGVIQSISITRTLASRGINPALLLVASFLLLITVGTLLLLLPRARAGGGTESAPFLTALFTSTSASCVTGLVVEPTGEYWSRFGQATIMILFQIGGLGIMTFGAIFVALAGRNLQVREMATLRKLLDSERISDVRRLLITILIFTFSAEILGAIMLSGLWSEESFGERTFQSLFHSISAFCNAGFSLTPDSFVGMGSRWQIWFGSTLLIITGGLGFSVIYNLFFVAKQKIERMCKPRKVLVSRKLPLRLSMTTRLVLWATVSLLVIATLGYYLLESFGIGEGDPQDVLWADAWFQAVTFRTAGFNTVDFGELQTTTKLFAIGMMFIGASPGSTGGGVKTVCVALIFLSVVNLLRGKDRTEIAHRKIPGVQIQRAFLIVTLGISFVMVTTFLLVLFESQPARLIDHLFEATSAFATVGLSTGITSQLTDPSRVMIAIAMFIGRVGPLTLMLALAGKQQKTPYDLPEERVALG